MNNSDILFTRKNTKLLEKIITGNSIYKKKTRHERYHDRVYLFIYEKSASADARKEKNNRPSDQ